MMIITLCGSARFEPWFHAWNEALSLSGHCVFGLGVYPSHKGTKDWYTLEEKNILDLVHQDKITVSRAILVLNVFAYIGESTLNEIAFARANSTETYFLESWGRGLGIGDDHFEHIQAARDLYRVPRGFGSPIVTAACNMNKMALDLLPDGGPLRSTIVDRLKQEALKHVAGWGFS
jgi:hypothetical protein